MFNRFRNILIGRNGVDALSVALMLTGAVVTFILSFVRVRFIGLITYIPYILALFRIFSTNIEQRRRENDAFIKYITPWKQHAEKKIRQYQDVNHKYYNCPRCGRTLRVPKGRGKIKISCPHCSKEFVKKT